MLLIGFRNGDLRPLLFAKVQRSPAEHKRPYAAVTRQQRLLRAHRRIKKVPWSHRYQVSEKGRSLLTALAAARAADTEKLLRSA